jgi:hypothetical protein
MSFYRAQLNFKQKDMKDLSQTTEGGTGSADVLPPENSTQPEMVATATGEPATGELPPETAPGPKPSEAFRNRIKGAYPDQDFSDDEAFFQKASEELDNLSEYRHQNIEANKMLMSIFEAEPEIPEVLKDMAQGASFREAIARHFSPEELTPQEGEPDMEGWAKNASAREKKLAERDLREKQKAENTEISTKSIQEFAKETNLDEAQAEEFLNKVGEALDEVYDGKISKSFLQSMYRALNYEKDLETAKSTGQIAGRNEKIETKKQPKPAGDGLPVLSGNDIPPAQEGKKKDWVSNLIDNEKKKQIL